MSLIIPRSILPEDWMLVAYRRCRSLSCSLPARTSEKPMIEFSGVRSSWLIVARKSLLSRFISKRARLAWASSSTLRSRSSLTVAQLLLHGDQVVEHPVEGVRELLELVAGLDLAADR